jgi:glycosyltransferase involved in cell wall biosynthesis
LVWFFPQSSQLDAAPARRFETSLGAFVVPALRRSGVEHTLGGTRPLSVSLVGSLPPVKGVSAYTTHLLEGLAADPDVKLDFIGFKSIYPRWAYPGGEPDEPGLAPVHLTGVRQRNMLAWYNPISWLRAGFTARGEIVHAQWWSYVLAPVYIAMLSAARLRGKRVLITVHNVAPHEEGFVKRLLNRTALRLGHAYIVHSEQNRATLQQVLGRRAGPISVVPHGVLESPRTGMTRAAAREKLALSHDARVVLCFGNIRPYKGVDILLRAFADVVAAEPNAVLVIAGKPWTDWAIYDTLIDDLGIRDHVRLTLDYIPTADIEPYFVAADVIALPYTHFDAQSGVGTRALPFGRPLVVSNVGGLPELVLDPEAIVEPHDPAALAAALLRVLRDEQTRDRMSVDSLTLAASLGWDVIAKRTAALYAALSGQTDTAGQDEQARAHVAGAPKT